MTVAAEQDDRPIGPRSRKGVLTRARLVDAAQEVFEESGFLDARISDIADRASLSHGSFYHYFDSKEQVFREVAGRVYDQLSAPLGEVILAPVHGLSPHARLHEALRLYLAAYRAQARIIAVIELISRYDDEVRALVLKRHREYTHQVAESIRQLQRRGLADPELDPEIAAAAVDALTGRFAELWLVEGSADWEFDIAVEQVNRFLLNGLGYRPGGETVDRPRRRPARARS